MSPAFMLDTDTVSYALRGQGGVAARIREHPPSDLCISAIALAELRFGAMRRGSARLLQAIDILADEIAVMPFDETCAARFGEIASTLAERGQPIGHMDVMIAAHAMALDLTLVTNNVKHFHRVNGLKVENWL